MFEHIYVNSDDGDPWLTCSKCEDTDDGSELIQEVQAGDTMAGIFSAVFAHMKENHPEPTQVFPAEYLATQQQVERSAAFRELAQDLRSRTGDDRSPIGAATLWAADLLDVAAARELNKALPR